MGKIKDLLDELECAVSWGTKDKVDEIRKKIEEKFENLIEIQNELFRFKNFAPGDKSPNFGKIKN